MADPYLWIRKDVNNEGCEYYEYMLLYVGDCLCFYGQPREALEQIKRYFPIKASSIGTLNIYIVENVGKVLILNGVEAHSISIIRYVQEAVKNVERYLHDRGISLLKQALTTLLTNYSP